MDKPVSEMVERVARDVCTAMGHGWNDGSTWQPDEDNNRYRYIAIAAIKAMREPTKLMLDAAEAEEGCGCPCCVRADDWEAMITAALGDTNAA